MDLKLFSEVVDSLKKDEKWDAFESAQDELLLAESRVEGFDLNKLFRNQLVNNNQVGKYLLPYSKGIPSYIQLDNTSDIGCTYKEDELYLSILEETASSQKREIVTAHLGEQLDDSNKTIYVPDYVEVPRDTQNGKQDIVDMYWLDSKGNVKEYGFEAKIENGDKLIANLRSFGMLQKFSVRRYDGISLDGKEGFNITYFGEYSRIDPIIPDAERKEANPSRALQDVQRLNQNLLKTSVGKVINISKSKSF